MKAETDYGKIFTITNNGSKNIRVSIHQYLNDEDVTITSALLFSKHPNGNPHSMHAIWNANLPSGHSLDVYMKLYTNIQEQYPCDFGNVIDRISVVAITYD